MFKNFKNFLKNFKLDIFCLIFSISQLGLNQENKEIITIYTRNIDWVYTIITMVTAIVIVLSLLLLVAYAILLERKVLGSIQKRRGPNFVGIFGLLQPIADAVKLIVKETIIPVSSNRFIFIIAPLLTLILSLLNWSIIPFSNFAVLADIRVSILMFFAISSLSVYGIIMSGWSSNSKYAFLGALRAAAQVIAYEVSIGLTLIYILLQTSDLNYSKIIFNQIGIWNIVPCFIFFVLFFISTLAETNRPPFDLPEAEAELVSGYNVEYSAMTFGFFFLGEYVAIWTVCCLNIILFWGGYLVIFDFNSIFIYSLKVIALVITFIWIRGSLPRYRYDQLMRLGWKILLPISLGFVILYSGYYYYKIYLILYEYYYLIELSYLKEYDWMINAKKLYNLYKIKLDLNIIKQNKINLNLNLINEYQNLIIENWKKNKNILKILEELKIIKKIEKNYLDIKGNEIFKMKKYRYDSLVSMLKDKYNLNNIQNKVKNKQNIYLIIQEIKLNFLEKKFNILDIKNLSKKYNILWYCNDILFYYKNVSYYKDLLEMHNDTWNYNDTEIYFDNIKLKYYKDLLEMHNDTWNYNDTEIYFDNIKLKYYKDLLEMHNDTWNYNDIEIYFDNIKLKYYKDLLEMHNDTWNCNDIKIYFDNIKLKIE